MTEKSTQKHNKQETSERSLPLVSVIMPVFNGGDYLHESITSIIDQPYRNIEYIIIDDHSSDDSWKVIQKYSESDSRIKSFSNEKNMGIAKTRNKGFLLVNEKSKYYAIFDSDDISLPSRIGLQVRYLESNVECALVGSSTIIIGEDSEQIGMRMYPTDYSEIMKVITRYNPIAQPSVMIRASVLMDDIGFYDEKYSRCQDYDLWLRIASRYEIKNMRNPLIKYRVSSSQGKTTSLKETLRFTIEIQRKWLFDGRFFNVTNIANWCVEWVLLLMPNRLILWLFKKKSY